MVEGMLGKVSPSARMVLALAVICVALVASVIFILQGGPDFSDAPAAPRLAIGGQGNTVDFQYEKCPGELTPHLEVWEESEGQRLPWAVFLGSVDDTAVSWIARRENGVTTEVGEDLSVLGPLREARIRVLVRSHDEKPVEISGLQLADLPETHASELLLADGRNVQREDWPAISLADC